MNLNDNLENFLNSQFFDEDFGTFYITLPINVRQYVAEKAAEQTKKNYILSTEDIINTWGDVDSFHIWKSGIVSQANELNIQYLSGMVNGLINIYNQYQLSVNGKRAKDLEKIETAEYVTYLLEVATNTDSE
ncbi:hypothetical protein [Acinetobacter modestus]|uniref:hypothetical protein n=1 Tax=Acinetobacter modestus TaxID=1776740 RepID=UPI001F4B5114|nr:hypothetical protein [Acinetobacter modestus]MCH7331209.1 hypothetical protein [Acinetobacter modestus]